MNSRKKLAAAILLTMLIFSPAYAFRFVVYGDCRAPDENIDEPFPNNIINVPVVNYINAQIVALDPKPAFAIFLGDGISFAQPKADPSISSNLDYWKTFMTDGLRGIPFYAVVGNEDLNTEMTPTIANQSAFAQTFNNMPDNGPTSPVDFRHLVYSFEYGNGTEKSLFVVFDSFGFYYGDGYTTTVYANNNVDPYAIPFEDGAPSLLPAEQIDWFKAQAAASDATHKFVFTHGPTFSVAGWTSVGTNMSQMWNIALNNNFDTYFCAHEHLYYRWNVDAQAYPTAAGTLIQNLSGTSGAPIIWPSSVNANPHNRIYFGFNFVVVDVEGSTVTEKAYVLMPNGNGSFTTKLFDTAVIVK